MNLPKKQTHRHREETCGCQRRVGRERMKDWEFGIRRCELLYIGWINNEDLFIFVYLHTGNYTLYAAINHNGKESKKEYLYLYTHIKLSASQVTQW